MAGKPRRPGRPRPQSAPVGEHPSGDRLQKVLAAAGLGSRRQCEDLITTGRVEVDRKVVTQLGTRVDPAAQDIRVDGESLSLGRRVYYAVNKPKGVVSTNRDPGRRPRVIDLVPNQDIRLFAIGRLDLNSEGLILVTNDGGSIWPRSPAGRRRTCSTSCGAESTWPKALPEWRTSASSRTRRTALGWRSRFVKG
jgi:23S rRNA pseudouridine2605 synthase